MGNILIRGHTTCPQISIDFTAVAYAIEAQELFFVVDGVEEAIRPLSQSIAIRAYQLFGSGRAGVATQIVDGAC